MTAVHGDQSPVRIIANAWLGDTMIEVIEANPDAESIYRGWHSDDSNPLRFHHFGYLLDTEKEFEAARAQLVASSFPIVSEGSFGEVLDYAYSDTTAVLGHYYELIRPKSEIASFFGRIPVN